MRVHSKVNTQEVAEGFLVQYDMLTKGSHPHTALPWVRLHHLVPGPECIPVPRKRDI